MASKLLPRVTIRASVGVMTNPVPLSSTQLIMTALSSTTSETLYFIRNAKALLALCVGCSKGLYFTTLRALLVCLKALPTQPSPPQLNPLNSVVMSPYVHSSRLVSLLLRPCADSLSCIPSVGSTRFKSDFVTFRLK